MKTMNHSVSRQDVISTFRNPMNIRQAAKMLAIDANTLDIYARELSDARAIFPLGLRYFPKQHESLMYYTSDEFRALGWYLRLTRSAWQGCQDETMQMIWEAMVSYLRNGPKMTRIPARISTLWDNQIEPIIWGVMNARTIFEQNWRVSL